MDIIKAHAVKNLCYIKAKKMTPKGIVVHSTGANNPYLKRYVDCPDRLGKNAYNNHWNQATPGGRKVCVHAFVGYDKDKKIRVAEILPLDICCWGVGKGTKGSYNYSPAYIQFEICEDGKKDKNYYQKAFSAAAQYCAHLCSRYNIAVDKIVGHCEAHKQGYGSNHSDPEHWMKNFGETMDDFRATVSKLLKNNEVAQENIVVSEKQETSNCSVIKDGDLVSISSNATYYSGKAIPKWVKNQRWYVKGNSKTDRIVIDKNEAGTNSICSPIHKKYLTVITASDEGKASTTEEKTNCPYRVKVSIGLLDIRKGAGTDKEKTGTITDRGVYTIVAEQTGKGASKWGKLKSGAGWISLDCVKKL